MGEIHGKRDAHIQRRRGHGLSFRELADAFGMSKSNAHRVSKKEASDMPAPKAPTGKAPKAPPQKPVDYSKDNRAGRMTPIKTDRGTFTFKANRKGD